MRSSLSIRIVAVAAAVYPMATHAQAGAPQQVRLTDAVPTGVRTTQLVVSSDARHVYYGDSTRAIWFYDRTDKRNVRLTNSGASDLTISPAGDAIAYVRTESASSEQHVWVLPLDAQTGLARGAERRASAMQGDTPAISPDGKWIAFAADDSAGVGQGVAITATAGGHERLVVPFMRAGIGSVRWSADAQTLYFAVNPPVACDPDWSCLPLKDEFSQRIGSVHRVPVSGGTPSVVAPRAGPGWPGLSTDGSMLAYRDTGFSARVIVTDTAGRQLDSFAVPGRETVEGWVNGSTLLLSDRGDVRRVRVASIASGASRIISDSLDQLVDAAFSPDGKTVSAARCVGDRCELRLIGVDGTARSVVALPARYGGGSTWSPDGKWIAYVGGQGAADRRLQLLEVSTGRIVPLNAIRLNAVGVFWQPDSHALVLSTISGSGAQRRVAFERVAIDGSVQALREFSVGGTPNAASVLDAHTALLLTNGEIHRVTIDGDSADAKLLSLSGARSGGMIATTPGTQRVAFRHRLGDSDRDLVEAINLDGSDHVTIELPFSTFPGPAGFRMAPGGQQVVVIGAPYGSEPNVGLYVIDFSTKSWKKLVTIPPMNFAGELALSSDGRALVYMTSETAAPRVYTMDLSSFKR